VYWRRPLSRLEVAVYAAVAAVLAFVLLDRLLVYFEHAERAAFEVTLLRAQSAMQTRLAYDILRGQATDVAEWHTRNPFELARIKLGNFAGDFDPPGPLELPPGAWAYDRGRRELVYAPRFRRGLALEGGGDTLRFRLELGEAGRWMPRLLPVVPYRWEP